MEYKDQPSTTPNGNYRWFGILLIINISIYTYEGKEKAMEKDKVI